MTLLLTRTDVAAVLDLDTCIRAVAHALEQHAQGRSLPSKVLGLHAERGGFHVKAAGLLGDAPTVAVKVNANFPSNPTRNGRPTIQGVVALFDADDGHVLALLDSGQVTALRTAAATAATNVPGATSSRWRNGAREGVHVTTRSAPRAASAGVAATVTGRPSSLLISPA